MRFLCRAFVLALFAYCGSAMATDSALSTVISSVCSGSSTMSAELTAKCDAAKVSAIDQAIQLGAVALSPASSSQLSLSATAAIKAQAELVKSVLATDTATLASIRPTTVTVPDMTAVAAASLQHGLQAAARTTADSLTTTLATLQTNTNFCPAASDGSTRTLSLVLMDQDLGDLRRAYFQAKDSTQLVREHIQSFSAFLAGFPDPGTIKPAETGKPSTGTPVAPGAPGAPQFTSAVAALTGAGLLLDLVGKGAALAASFRPVHTSASGTVTGDFQAIAQAALVSELARLGYPVLHSTAILSAAPREGAGSLRYELKQLRSEAYKLRQQAAVVAEYDYVNAARRAALDVRTVGDNGKPLSKTDLATAKQAERERLVALATAKQAMVTKLVAEVGTFTRAVDDLNTMIFSGYPAKDQTPLTPPLITSFDKWELAHLRGRCVVTLTLKPGAAHVDKLAVQSAFGSPKYHYKVTGTQPWMLASERGEALAAGVMATSASWDRFGPKD